MKRIVITEASPGLDLKATIWNGFVDLLALSSPEELTPEQRRAQLVFWYNSEVMNGGHLQYFLNQGSTQAREAIGALVSLGATERAKIRRPWTST